MIADIIVGLTLFVVAIISWRRKWTVAGVWIGLAVAYIVLLPIAWKLLPERVGPYWLAFTLLAIALIMHRLSHNPRL